MTLKSLLLVLSFIFCVNPIMAQPKVEDTPPEKLIVGIAGTEPFVFPESSTGISVDIWERISKKLSWDYEYKYFDNVEDALHALTLGNLDLVVGPISITANRMGTMRFSQPFYNSSISIISRIEDEGIWQKIKPLFSIKLLMAVGLLLIILAIVGTFLWLAEREKSPEQFSREPLKGIGTGMWLAIVTMSTTGYGDKAPITLMGRIIAGSWMVVSIIFATTMVAGIASTLTISNFETSTISNVEQLAGRKVATISGSTSEGFLKKTKAKVLDFNNLDDAISKLESKNVDAVVFDRPQLLYFIKENKKDKLYISKAEYFKQGYGFAFPINSKLVLKVNRALLELAENQETNRIIHTYIERDE